MAHYKYNELDVDVGELRLVDLQPGSYHDTLRCNIVHCPLLEPKAALQDERLPIRELQKTLSDGWTVEKTLDGRYLFMSPRGSGIPNSWIHPDAQCDPKAYEMPNRSTGDSFSLHVPPYEALSYAWGAAGDEDYVYVVDPADPLQTSSRLPIRPNLASALRHLRYPNRQRTLWVDAISINQTDMTERGRQVKRMSQIYPLSENVIIWLGPESDDSALALETLRYFSEQVEYVIDHRWGDAPDALERNWWREGHVLPYDETTWKSILSLLRRPWFQRVWVLQEALSCDRVLLRCGRDSIPWVSVRKTLLVLRQKASVLPPDIRSFLFPYARGLMAPPLASSEHLLLWARTQSCTDPKDKIYGMLGLLDPRIVAKIVVDYSMPVWKTYSQLVLAENEVYQKLNMLNHCNITKCREGSPSWVPNWEQPIEGANIGHLSIRRFATSGRSGAVAKLIEPAFHLQVTGRRVDSIRRVGNSLTGTFAEVFDEILLWAPREPSSDKYVSGGLSLDAYFEVITRSRTNDRAPAYNPFPPIKRLTELWKKAMTSGKVDNEIAHDEVAVLLGCDLPTILRPKGSNQYEVVGPCCVEGVMFGEALKPPLEPPWKNYLPVTKGWALSHFINAQTGEVLSDDPRLGSLPTEWEETTSTDPFLPPFVFKNRETGRISMNDPRMSAEAIQQRGIELESLELV